jgi:hypothetical protein
LFKSFGHQTSLITIRLLLHFENSFATNDIKPCTWRNFENLFATNDIKPCTWRDKVPNLIFYRGLKLINHSLTLERFFIATT